MCAEVCGLDSREYFERSGIGGRRAVCQRVGAKHDIMLEVIAPCQLWQVEESDAVVQHEAAVGPCRAS